MKRFLLLLALVPAMAHSQGYPNRAVRMIVPFAPGGASDLVGRILQPRMSELLGQQVVVENRGGAAGNIGVEAGARSAPDGYTFVLGNIGSIAINPAVFPNLSVTPTRDLIAVTQVVDVPSALVAHPSFAPNNIKELIDYARANPGKLNYASPGSGSQNRLEMEVLRKLANLDMVHVPYKGGAGPAVGALVAGETNLMFVTASSALGHVKAGRLKILAVSTLTRMEQFPQTATTTEQGFPELRASSWQGVFLPAGTPKDIVERLFTVARETMATPEVVQRLTNGGVIVATSATPAAFAEFVATETQRWAKVVKEAGATPD
ncbi:MAG TPA: tripartite tricarboxylate transporter substrate binding protein [Burkholderiales bacterium]|jgi:tripartite-type tricarboxylate transporter receptor subunit TctC|nr:tripartite tricarboxylate transporter substrate binding protein [Burkholderiales bacterium]